MTIINIFCCYYVHGLDGYYKDFQVLKTKIEEKFNLLFQNANANANEVNKVINIHYGYSSNDNAFLKTHSEFKIIANKSFNELNKFIEDIALTNFKNDYEKKYNNFENVHCHLYFTIIGHSLGGLISRGVIKHIYSPFEKENITYDNYFDYLQKKFSFITSIQPCSFLTLSSPHLGSMAREESGGIYKTSEKAVFRIYCNYLSGNIGKIFIYKDTTDEKPVLIQLTQKEAMDALSKFPNRTLMGCIRYDLPVRFCSTIANMNHPIHDYEKENLLIDNSKNDTRICSYSGYNEGEELNFYQKEVFNEKVSKDMFYKDTKIEPLPNIDEQIKNGLKAINFNQNNDNDTQPNYEEMEDVFIPDTINQVEVAVSAFKLFNQIPYRRIILDFCVPNYAKFATHGIYMGNTVVSPNETVNKVLSKSVNLISNIILADYIRTSEQSSTFSLNDIVDVKSDENETEK